MITLNEIDLYIEGFPENIKILLDELRDIVKSNAPDSTEVISYGMPAYKQNGMLLYFAGNKNHIGLYPTASPIIAFQEELKIYKTSKGAIQFPLDKPLPVDLISRIIRYKVQENLQKKTKTKN